MGLALSGLASGFDWKSIVDQLIEVSRAPQNRLRQEKSQLSQRTNALNDIKTQLGSLKSAAASLSSGESLLKKAASFQNPSTNWTASAESNTPSGTYQFEFISPATASRYQGTSGIANPINTADPISSIPVGRTITAGSFTVNGARIDIESTDSLNDVFGKITGATGGTVTAGYNAVTGRVEMVSADPITLGASNDTSNFLQAMRLTSGGSPVITSGPPLPSPRLTGPIDSANLAGWSGTNEENSFFINGVGISYNTGTDSIQSLLNRINNSAAGVTASFDLASGSFVLTNKQTGNVGISVTGDAGGLATAMGLTGGSLTSGDDAKFKINGGGEIASRSNTLDETVHGIPGLRVTANTTGSLPETQTVTVGGDTAAAKAALNDFISKYNSVQSTIERYTRVTVDGDKVTAAVLAGNREVAQISSELRRMLFVTGNDSNGDPLEGPVKRLSDLGINFSGIESSISITNASLLDSRLLNNANDIFDYFGTKDNGLAARLDSFLGRLVSDSGSAQGSLKTQLDSITKQNKSLDSSIANFERQLESQRALLESSFIAMENAQSIFQQQSAYLARTFAPNNPK
jgi:flagellar hook-associated protein 2